MDRKRPNVFNVFGQDSLLPPQTGTKKLKGNAPGIPSYKPTPVAPDLPSTAPPHVPPPPPPPGVNLDFLAQKRAEIQAKLALMKSRNAQFQQGTGTGTGTGVAPIRPPSNAPPPPPPPALTVPGLPAPNLDPDLARKVAEAKKMVESFQAKKRAYNAAPINPYLSPSLQQSRKNEPALDPALAGRGGLNMTAHPLLMDTSVPTAQTKKEKYRPMVPLFASTKANARQTLVTPRPSTPVPTPEIVEESEHFDPRLSYGLSGVPVKTHMGRGPARDTLKFNQRGKFVKIGESMRQEAKFDELKLRVLESARKAGLESDMEDKAKIIKRAPPPDIEWWDAPFLPGKTYDTYSPSFLETTAAITMYIQHPIQIPAPQDKIKVEAKALFLTKKEMKKMRRQRRMAELQDKQDRIKMGLLPTPKPKVKLANMMRVLTQDAISDPTKVEAQVRREMIARERGHMKRNAEAKKTDDQVWEKEQEKMRKDESKGIGTMVYRIRYLTNPGHKLKVRKTAEADGLTGIIIYHPKYCLVVVEGGAKGLKHYKQLMTHRIDWTEEARSRLEEETDVNGQVVSTSSSAAVTLEATPSLEAMNRLVAPASLADNTCTLIWNGSHKERLFNGFRQKNCPSDALAKEALGTRLEGLWDIAKTREEDEDE